MMAVVAENETTQAAAAASDNDNARPLPAAKLLDPQLLMAARRGDSDLLKELLHLKKDEEHAHGMVEAAAAASSEVVIVDVVPQRRSPAPAPAAAAPPSPPSSGPAASAPPPLADGVTLEGDTLLHVVAACDDGKGFLLCAKMIVHDYYGHKGGAAAVRLALEARNSKGDTPLHCAAAAGNANMISCLVDLLTNAADEAAVKAFLGMQNKCGETALHQAVRAVKNKEACIDQLMDVDPELACIPREDAAGASPLYLAISLGEVEIARHLYGKSKGRLSYSGPDGRNVLHEAVHRGQALPMILEWLIKDMKPNKEDGLAKQCAANEQGDRHMSRTSRNTSSVSLVSQLTSQRDKKQKGSTPLHLAASLEGWSAGAWILSRRRFPQVWPTGESMATLLLDANESTAYQADDEGSYPIHVAAWSDDSLGVVKLLLERCPDCATLRDGKGRTFLHVAAEQECHAVVQYACGEIMPQQLSSWMMTMILTAQDSNGDTALHGAVRAGNLAVFNCLLRNPRVRLDAANKDGMTPLDLSRSMIPSALTLDYVFNPRSIVLLSLLYAGAPHGGGRSELFREQHITKIDKDKESQRYTDATQVMGIVAVLIATVTFASAFTLPGGYLAADGGDAAAAGTAVLARGYAFDAFILADTLAFICSTLATFSLVYAGVPAMDISIRCHYFYLSAFLLQSAGRSFVAAFALALYLVLAPVDHTTAVAVCVIIFASSLWGNVEAWSIVNGANTVRARIGIRRLQLWDYTQEIFFYVLIQFGSYIIILGLPAIRKYVGK